MSDLNLNVTVRNARLLRAIRAKFGTTAELCRASGASQTAVSALLTMRESPFRQDGSLTSTAEMVVSALGIPADELWPAHIARLKAKRATVEVEIDVDAFAAIADDNPERAYMRRQMIARWSENVNPRDMEVLALRADGASLDEAGAQFGVTRERIRQMELRAHRVMRKAALRDGVRDMRGIEG
jgi:DNA-directed RNA polymerase sigma subunit (sigma70/sigma32)